MEILFHVVSVPTTGDVLPFHYNTSSNELHDLGTVKWLLKRFLHAIEYSTEARWLPLHYAVLYPRKWAQRGGTKCVAEYVLHEYPEATRQSNMSGILPLRVAVASNCCQIQL